MKILRAKLLDSTALAGTFTGYASTFGPQPDRQGDVIAPGAFDATLATWAARGGAVPLLYSHDPSRPIGSLSSLSVDDVGLAVTGRIAVDTPDGAQAYSLLQAGALSMSIGFTAEPADQYTIGEVTVITALDLFEVSLTAMPANPGAVITGVKSLAECRSITEFEKSIRTALGLTQTEAKKAASASWPLIRRDGVSVTAEKQHREGEVSGEAVKKAVAILLRSANLI